MLLGGQSLHSSACLAGHLIKLIVTKVKGGKKLVEIQKKCRSMQVLIIASQAHRYLKERKI